MMTVTKSLLGLSLIAFAACSHKSTNKAPGPANNPNAATTGSCMTADTCAETTGNISQFAALCTATKGSWTGLACDQSKYATKCVQDSYTNYFPKDSKFGCLGTSSVLHPATGSGNAGGSTTGNTSGSTTGNNGSPTVASVPVAATLAAGFKMLAGSYCTVTLATDVSSDFKAGVPYLLTASGAAARVASVDTTGLQVIDTTVKAANVATSTCKFNDFFLTGSTVVAVDTAVYPTEDFSKVACTLTAGTGVTDLSSLSLSTGSVSKTTFEFVELPSLCGGLNEGHSNKSDPFVTVFAKGA